MTDSGMGNFAREDVYTVLGEFGIAVANRVVGTDASEEVILLTAADFARVDPDSVARALMDVLPHTKVWVIDLDHSPRCLGGLMIWVFVSLG